MVSECASDGVVNCPCLMPSSSTVHVLVSELLRMERVLHGGQIVVKQGFYRIGRGIDRTG